MVGIVLIAAVLRVWNVTQLPPGYWYDEAHKSLVALEISRGQQFPIYVTDYQGIEAGYFWLLAGWFRLFGPSFYATRYLAALIGTLTVPLTYWAVVTAYQAHAQRRLIALASAAWLAFLLWHVLWSRLGLENITVPFFAIALLGLMALAWQRRQRWLFALTGAVLGTSLYTSPGARVLVIQALVTFAIFSHGPWRQRLVFGLFVLAPAALIFAPLAIFFIRQPQWFFDRLAGASASTRAGGWQAYAANAVNTLLAIVYRGDVLPRHNLSLRPVFDPLSDVCLVAGVASFWSGRAAPNRSGVLRAHAALLASLGLNMLPSVLSDGAPEFGRMLGATPFVVVLPALGIVFAAQWLTTAPYGRLDGKSALSRAGHAVNSAIHPSGKRSNWPGRALLLVIVLGAASWNLYDYFYQYPRQPGLFDAFELGQWTLIQDALGGSRANIGYLVLNEPALIHPATKLAGLLATGDLRQVNGTTCLAYPAATTGPVVLATLADWQAPLAARLPGARVETILHTPQVYPYGALFYLPAGYTAPANAEQPVAEVGSQVALLPVSLPAAPVQPGAIVSVTLRWRVAQPLTGRYNVFVHLTDSQQPLVAGADGEPCGGWYPTNQWHTNEVVEHTLALKLPDDLSPGAYPVAVGMYDWQSGVRLPVVQNNQREPDRAFVGSIEVK